MSYLTQLLLPQVQKGLAVIVNQFFAGYPTLTILGATAVRVQGVVGVQVTVTGDGTRHFAAEFASTTSAQACQQIETFLISNPSVVPIQILDLSTPNRRQAIRDRLLLIYSNAVSLGGMVLPQGALSAGVVGDAQILGAYGDPRGLVSLRSVGDASWPVGGRGVAWRSKGTGTWGGVGRRAYTGVPPAYVTTTTVPTTIQDPKCCGGPTDPVPTTPPSVVNTSSTTAFPVSLPSTTPGWTTPATPSSSTPAIPTTSVPRPETTAPPTTTVSGPTFSVPTTPYTQPPVATPIITPAGGSISPSDNIAISCATAGATIRYTLDGSTPTGSSTIYSAPFTLASSATVTARAFKTGCSDSAVASEDFLVVVPNPTRVRIQVSGAPIIVSGPGSIVGHGAEANGEWILSLYLRDPTIANYVKGVVPFETDPSNASFLTVSVEYGTPGVFYVIYQLDFGFSWGVRINVPGTWAEGEEGGYVGPVDDAFFQSDGGTGYPNPFANTPPTCEILEWLP